MNSVNVICETLKYYDDKITVDQRRHINAERMDQIKDASERIGRVLDEECLRIFLNIFTKK